MNLAVRVRAAFLLCAAGEALPSAVSIFGATHILRFRRPQAHPNCPENWLNVHNFPLYKCEHMCYNCLTTQEHLFCFSEGKPYAGYFTL